MNYKDLLSSIKLGEIITFIVDFDAINNELFSCIKKHFEKDYIIKDNIQRIWETDIKIITEKTILIIDYNKREMNIRSISNIQNKNVIIIFKELQYKPITNTLLFGDNKLAYCSSSIFLLKNKKLKMIKSRHLLNKQQSTDILKLVRSIKLKTIDKN